MMLLGKEERKLEKLMICVGKNKMQTWLSSSWLSIRVLQVM